MQLLYKSCYFQARSRMYSFELNQILNFILLLLVIFLSAFAYSQNSNLVSYEYISPLPGSSLILPENNIIIRHGEIIDESTIGGSSKIEVNGSLSGNHSGEFILSTDLKTLIFKPDLPFSLREEVTVKLYSGIITKDEKQLLPIEFSFTICEIVVENYSQRINLGNNCCNRFAQEFEAYKPTQSNEQIISNDLPDDFQILAVNRKNNPSDGYFFLSPYTLQENIGHLIITDNSGIPIFYRRTPDRITDFKLQPNGFLTYGLFGSIYFHTLDSSYTVVDSTQAGNGYAADKHDFLITEDNHSLLMIYDPQTVRMDTVIQGGDSSATVIGLIIQELDVDKNVIFQWRSWDHFSITDATEDFDLTRHTIDYVHGNSIEVDYDGNLLISSRHMDEITKIDRHTGQIIWRWGGIKSRNNEFQFIGDPITFSHQHDIRHLLIGNYTLFDNGNLHEPKISSGREYQLDESNKTATLIWDYHTDTENYTPAMGNTQRLSDQNTIIGWGWFNTDSLALTEVKPDGTVAFEASLLDPFVSYRALKFPWRTNYFVTKPDSISFETISVGDSSSISVSIESNSSESIFITGFYNEYSSFIIEHPLPFELLPYGSEQFEIKFIPTKDGFIEDALHIRSDTDSSRIAQIIILTGSAGTEPVNDIINTFYLEQNYPNPFNPITAIKYQIPENAFVIMKLYDAIGNEVSILVNEQKLAGSYTVELHGESLSSGIYFYRLSSSNLSDVKKMILIK